MSRLCLRLGLRLVMTLRSNELSFFVNGSPVPQGSKTGYVRNGRAVLVEANKKLPVWRKTVKFAALEAINQKPWVMLNQPVKLVVNFYLPRPKDPKHKQYPGSKPDLDKLVRAVSDALTEAGVWKDDSLVVELFATKAWANHDFHDQPEPGCFIHISPK